MTRNIPHLAADSIFVQTRLPSLIKTHKARGLWLKDVENWEIYGVEYDNHIFTGMIITY